ncbi:ABC transporter substrate-binding protein [Paraburkholderia edwinii]|jgi:ribose transport system substrate-binding protein|uniref:ABC transporter substrate-binding protein n=1 Tax=Paraburkholderia edwinii TaxID=2861782 RepID=A0ABX8V3C3_9BURK|nr:ABC transporter substrate-binding protein [Paraburkholderia edwinii]QYD73568.1 ABC transporter substrate-binding protein [Paraburkholderia edwinii]
MRRSTRFQRAIVLAAAAFTLAAPLAARADYTGAPRTFLFNPTVQIPFSDTAKFKKKPPYVIGFSNAGLGDSWRVVMQQSLMKAASEHSDLIKQLLITNGNMDDAKQAADIQDLISRGVDLLIVSANTQKALDPVVTRAMKQGIPVVMVDRRISSDNFVSFVTGSDAMMGRLWAQWIVEKLHGKGNVIMLAGQAGSSVSADREAAAHQVFSQYPGIKVLDTVYSDWSPVKARQQMQAMIAKYGHSINAVWCAHGLPVAGSIDAFVAAGFKPGEIPPHTTADLNGPLQLALKYKIPMLEIGYPPSMGGTSLDVALKVLQGQPLPKIYEISPQIALTRGDETASVPHPDQYIDQVVDAKGPPDEIIDSGMGPGYNPTTFKVKLPGEK